MPSGWKSAEQREARRRAAQRAKILKWTAVVGVAVAVIYGLSQMSPGVAYTDRDITAVNFSGLTGSQKQTALVAANQARCNCSCGMTLAQCVATDSTCPVRESNIDRIKTMVTEAMRSE